MSWQIMVSERISSGARTVTVSVDRAGQRLDNFLARHLKNLPRAALYRVIRTGQVRVNGGRAKPSRRLEAGDRIRIPPARLAQASRVEIPPAILQKIEAAIIFEDAGLLVLDKPSGLAVHGGSGVRWGVIDAVRQLRPDAVPELAHRLDRETSGCLLISKNAEFLRSLHEQFRNNETSKRYFCLMDGRLTEDKVIVNEPLKKLEKSGERYMVVDPEGKPAQTEFRLLDHYSGFSFVEALPMTGRTHQIRAHAAFLGLPLAGDARYAKPDRLKHWQDKGLGRLFLHAHALTVTGADGEPLQFSCRLPVALREVLDEL
jgi:23S rRNA pseudouridine955/2504/2580 synthase